MINKIFEKSVVLFAWISSTLLFLIVFSLIGYLFYNGFTSINISLIFGQTNPLKAILFQKQVFDGLLPAIFGTLSLVFISVAIAIPIGIASGLYMAEYCHGTLRAVFSFFFDILASIPSILVGLFGFSVTLFLHHYFAQRIYPCLLISSISLAFLILPYLIRTTQIAIESIPFDIRCTGLALGATKLQNIFYILIPHCLSTILSGIILAIGRCAEDTAVIMLTGAVASAGIPKSILSNYEALPFYIYYISSQYTDKQELMKGYGAAIILLIICTMLFVLAFFIKNQLKKQSFSKL